MAGHASNRDRIARMAQEAAIGKKEKEAAAAERAARPKASSTKSSSPKSGTRRATASSEPRRIKYVWNLCDPSGATVKTFAYPEEQVAREEAARVTQESGKTHFVTRGEAPL